MPRYDLDDIGRLCEIIYEIDRMPKCWTVHIVDLLPEARLIVERLEKATKAQRLSFRRPVR